MYACMHVCMYACMHVCMYAGMQVCRYACMHVCMYACMHVCMYACMHVCMYACMYACTYVRTYVRTYVYVQYARVYVDQLCRGMSNSCHVILTFHSDGLTAHSKVAHQSSYGVEPSTHLLPLCTSESWHLVCQGNKRSVYNLVGFPWPCEVEGSHGMASPRRGEEGPQAPSSSSRKVVGKLMPSKSAEVAKPHRLRLPGQGSVQGPARKMWKSPNWPKPSKILAGHHRHHPRERVKEEIDRYIYIFIYLFIYLKPPARSAWHERLEPCCPGPSATSLYPWRLLQRLPGWSRQTTKCQLGPPRTKPLRPLPGVGLGMPWSVKVSGLLNVPWRRCQGSALATRLFFGPCGKWPTPRFSGIPKSTAYHHFLNKDVTVIFGYTTAFFEKPISSGCFQTLQESALQITSAA